VLARAAHKPFYVTVESYKFVREYPLTPGDLGPAHLHPVTVPTPTPTPPPAATVIAGAAAATNAAAEAAALPTRPASLASTVDYTPPAYITLLITDLGVLTPSAVSDELIKLYG
jgi:translation initiation factor eIF-2B subunit alpha